MQRHLSSDTLLQNYTAVLEIILRLRQICDHAALCPGEDPVFAAEAAAGQALTPEVTEMLIQLLKVCGCRPVGVVRDGEGRGAWSVVG